MSLAKSYLDFWRQKIKYLQDKLMEANQTGNREKIRLLLFMIQVAEEEQQYWINYKPCPKEDRPPSPPPRPPAVV